jgi:hypothetical protein
MCAMNAKNQPGLQSTLWATESKRKNG